MSSTLLPVVSYDRLPARASAAARVLSVVDDPTSGSVQVARAIAADPALAARTIALANSAYYGLSSRIATLPYAIAVIGLQTIRALAVSVAAGMDDPDSAPEEFWDQAATVATAASLIAPILGAGTADAFTLGLLHCLGSALLHLQQPLPGLCLARSDGVSDVCEREYALYGIDHAQAGARALRAWRFPSGFCALVADHHDVPLPDAGPLERCLHAARELAELCLRPDVEQNQALQRIQWLSQGRLTPAMIPPLAAQIYEHSAALLSGLEPYRRPEHP
jgi:HD-like signal output (HDOD) protein